MDIDKLAKRVAGYRDDTWMIIYGNYDCVYSLCNIIDKVWRNGAGGHSFGTVIVADGKDVIKAGGFDGDGAAYIDWIACGVSGKCFKADQFYHGMMADDTEVGDCNEGTYEGDSFVAIKGTREGIDSIKRIVDNILNFTNTSENYCHLFTDDSPRVDCGSYGGKMFDQEFGFYFISHHATIFDKPLEVISKFGYKLTFFRS